MGPGQQAGWPSRVAKRRPSALGLGPERTSILASRRDSGGTPNSDGNLSTTWSGMRFAPGTQRRTWCQNQNKKYQVFAKGETGTIRYNKVQDKHFSTIGRRKNWDEMLSSKVSKAPKVRRLTVRRKTELPSINREQRFGSRRDSNLGLLGSTTPQVLILTFQAAR